MLDVGCNQGAILFAINKQVKCGVGGDFEYKVINVCHSAREVNDINNLNFYMFNLDVDPLENILDFIPESRVDVVFAMAVCAHIVRWRELIRFIVHISPVLVFEANRSTEKKLDQEAELKRNWKNCRIIYEKSEDDGGNRSLWVAEN